MPTTRNRNLPRNVRPTHFWVLEFPSKDGVQMLGYIEKAKAEKAHSDLVKSADMALEAAEQIGHTDFAEALKRDKAATKLREYGFKPGNPTAPPGKRMKPKSIILCDEADILVGGKEYPEGQAFTRAPDGSYTRI